MILNGFLLITTDMTQSFKRLGPFVRTILAWTVQKYVVGLQIGYGPNGKIVGPLRKFWFQLKMTAQLSTIEDAQQRKQRTNNCTELYLKESEKIREY
jgi:hypothetical protein